MSPGVPCRRWGETSGADDVAVWAKKRGNGGGTVPSTKQATKDSKSEGVGKRGGSQAVGAAGQPPNKAVAPDCRSLVLIEQVTELKLSWTVEK